MDSLEVYVHTLDNFFIRREGLSTVLLQFSRIARSYLELYLGNRLFRSLLPELLLSPHDVVIEAGIEEVDTCIQHSPADVPDYFAQFGE